MWSDFSNRIINAKSPQEYECIIEEIEHYLYETGRDDDARELIDVASLTKNRFSKREAIEEFNRKKRVGVRYCEKLKSEYSKIFPDMILRILENFSDFCRKLYKSRVHEKCSDEAKRCFNDFSIENEYDLQKLMYAALSVVYPDARTEVSKDSGHHTIREDIVIDSEEAVIELKCTRPGMTERQLSEEVASDIVHYEYKRLYFYIYDKSRIIGNVVSFKQTYISIDSKAVRMVIYYHDDI